MCRHCENLVEDKQVVHAFAEQAAKRINERWSKEKNYAHPITADDISIKIEVVQQRDNVYSILRDMYE